MAHQLTLNSTSLEELKTLAAALPDEKKIQESKSVTPTTSAQTVTPDSGYDGLAKVTVGAMAAGSVGTPSITVNSSGLISVTTAVDAGYVDGTDKSNTKQLTVQAAKTITPTKSAQTAVASGRYTTGAVTVAAIPAQYITTTDATATANDIVSGTTAYVNGTKVSGANPYAKAATDAEVAEQEALLVEIANTLQGKAMPGGSGGEDVTAETNQYTSLLGELETTVNALPDAGGSGTCMVDVSGIPAGWLYTTVDNAGNFSGKRAEVDTGTLSVACNTMITAGYIGSTFENGYFTCTNAEMVYKHNFYYASFLITAPVGGIATISYTSTSICCFASGTPVLTSLQGDTAAIETFNVGDDIVSYDIKTGKNYVTKVNRVVVHENTTDMAEVLFENGATLTMNAYHPIFTNNGFHSLTRYDGYDELVVGDMAKTADGWTRVVEIKRYQSEPIVTYNLGVANIGETNDDDTNDTYYANGIVVHNIPTCS